MLGDVSTPTPDQDTTRKLLRDTMAMFGRFPQQDLLRLTTCHICHLTVKTEAFSSHLELQHSQPLQAADYQATSADKTFTAPGMQQEELDMEQQEELDMEQQEESTEVQQDSGMVCDDEI